MSLEHKSEFAELILEVFDKVLFAPGDWHTGMNMMQSIYNIYWHLLLRPMKKWLKIVCLSKDVRNCYYEAHKLLMFCRSEFSQYLWYVFVSDRWEGYKAQLLDHRACNVVTQLAIDFHAFIVDAHQSDKGQVDEHLKMMAGFILLVNDFSDFIHAYQNQDSIGAEHGYQYFVPVWKQNGQNKYVKC